MLTINRRNTLMNHPESPFRWMLQNMPSAFESLIQEACPCKSATNVRMAVSEHEGFVEFDLPGIDPASINVSVNGPLVTVTAQPVTPTLTEGWKWLVAPVASEAFSQQARFPFRIQGGRAEAAYDEGVLRITVARPEGDRPIQLAVKIPAKQA